MLDAGRVERRLAAAVERSRGPGAPARLGEAVAYAVFPGGARVRPKLTLCAAKACGDRDLRIAVICAAAVELLHCASLVHDDLPIFDDAAMRRGKPSVHAAFGEPLALLAGDALIVAAFEELSRVAEVDPSRLARLLTIFCAGAGMPGGIVAGQGWECEASVDIATYHRQKTGGLFAVACEAGALAAGADPAPWRRLGVRIGEAYQIADDHMDEFGDPALMGKPRGQDSACSRPNAVHRFGRDACQHRMLDLVFDGLSGIPDHDARSRMEQYVARALAVEGSERMSHAVA
ncbi:MAG: geranylgeranyl pyrophosphate synthase [Rhizobiales bacterium]|nr:geranylgeranyl pyrophosphate synthase [Hyphomicrobiales bacterium]